MRECVNSRICVYFIALKFHRSEFLQTLHNMRHMRICFNEHMCAYVDGIHKSISNQIHKECSHKGYCIVWDIISVLLLYSNNLLARREYHRGRVAKGTENEY